MPPVVSPLKGKQPGGHFVQKQAESEYVGARVEIVAAEFAPATCTRECRITLDGTGDGSSVLDED